MADDVDLLRRKGRGLGGRLVQPSRLPDGVLLQRLVADRQPEGEPEHRLRLFGRAVALGPGQRLQEAVDSTDGDLAQRIMLEHRHDQLAYVPLIERPGAGCQLPLQVEVLEPQLHQLLEGAVGRELGVGRAARPL